MAVGYLPAIGSEFGPCEQCEHSDCASGRTMLVTPCRICKEPIDTRAFFQEGSWETLVHAVCAYKEVDR